LINEYLDSEGFGVFMAMAKNMLISAKAWSMLPGIKMPKLINNKARDGLNLRMAYYNSFSHGEICSQKIMKGTKMKSAIIFMILFMASSAFAQFYGVNPALGFIPAVNDARARAMGRTEIMTATGPAAMFYNPANLGFAETMTADITYRGLFGTIDDKDYWETRPDENWSGKYPLDLNLTQFSFVLVHHESDSDKRAAIAFGYNNYLDWGINLDQKYENYRYDLNLGFTKQSVSGGVRTISIGGAFNINNRIAVGMSAHSSLLGKIKIFNDYSHEPESSDPYFVISRERKYKLSAFFIAFGATINLPKSVRVGLIIKPGYQLTASDYKYKIVYLNGDIYSNDNDQKIKVKIPTIYGIGTLFKLTKSISVATEYQNRPYANCEYENNTNIFGDIKNGHCFRIGMEYVNRIPIRFGYFIEAIPVADEESDNNQPASLNGFTMGFGFDYGFFRTDLYAEYAFWKHKRGGAYDQDTFYGRESLVSIGTTLTFSI
jgi:hypothetical protein